MVTTEIKKLATLRERVARLERVIETELYEDLFGIHQRYGFADVKSFIEAVKLAARGGGRRKGGKVGRPKKVVGEEKIRRRAKITDATRAKVKKLVKAGMSGSKIAKAVGISLPSVHNIKKALGLVKTRKLKAKRVVAAKKTAPKKLSAKKAPAKSVVAKRKPARKRPVVKATANNASAAVTEPPAPPAAKSGYLHLHATPLETFKIRFRNEQGRSSWIVRFQENASSLPATCTL